MDVDTLNSLVTSAIWRAEHLDDLGIENARSAWAEVSSIEEELARVLPASDSEGQIARRGAVSAALKAGDYGRAKGMAKSFGAAGAFEETAEGVSPNAGE